MRKIIPFVFLSVMCAAPIITFAGDSSTSGAAKQAADVNRQARATTAPQSSHADPNYTPSNVNDSSRSTVKPDDSPRSEVESKIMRPD